VNKEGMKAGTDSLMLQLRAWFPVLLDVKPFFLFPLSWFPYQTTSAGTPDERTSG
jgi:hypothetical protein